MLITVETTEPVDAVAADELVIRLNDTAAYADLEMVLHSEATMMFSGTDLAGQRAAALDGGAGDAPLGAQLAVLRSTDFYSAANLVQVSSTALTQRLRAVHIETADEHIVLADPTQALDDER